MTMRKLFQAHVSPRAKIPPTHPEIKLHFLDKLNIYSNIIQNRLSRIKIIKNEQQKCIKKPKKANS